MSSTNHSRSHAHASWPISAQAASKSAPSPTSLPRPMTSTWQWTPALPPLLRFRPVSGWGSSLASPTLVACLRQVEPSATSLRSPQHVIALFQNPERWETPSRWRYTFPAKRTTPTSVQWSFLVLAPVLCALFVSMMNTAWFLQHLKSRSRLISQLV